MNLSLIINVIILIFIIHLILINLDFKHSFNINENYSPPTLSKSYSSPQDDLKDFLNINETVPSNYFVSNDNSSNFSSNINPIDKYYSYNQDSTKPITNEPQTSEMVYSNYLNNENDCDKSLSTNITDLRNGMFN